MTRSTPSQSSGPPTRLHACAGTLWSIRCNTLFKAHAEPSQAELYSSKIVSQCFSCDLTLSLLLSLWKKKKKSFCCLKHRKFSLFYRAFPSKFPFGSWGLHRTRKTEVNSTEYPLTLFLHFCFFCFLRLFWLKNLWIIFEYLCEVCPCCT